MNNTLKISSATILGATLSFGATTALTPSTAILEQQKAEITKSYVYAQVRLNEIPTLDLSVVSVAEMTKAYADLATEKNALTKANLFEGLHDKAVLEGTACK